MAASRALRSTGWAVKASTQVAGKSTSCGGGTDPGAMLMPIPRITAPRAPSCQKVSARMPQVLRRASSTSLGHLICGARPSVFSSAMHTASPPSGESSARWGSSTGEGRNTILKARADPGRVTQRRCSRPRPLVCSSAATTAPSGAPASAQAWASSMVEPMEG